MADYKHGAYGRIQAVGNRVADEGRSAIVYVGTAPVHRVIDSDKYINTPIVVHNVAEAQKYFGYNPDDVENMAYWTLVEPIRVHLATKGVGPIILINVFNPDAKHGETKNSVSKTAVGGQIIITDAYNIYLDSLEVVTQESTPRDLQKDTDYTIAYDHNKKSIVITLLDSTMATATMTIKYYVVNISGVTASDVIGTTDGEGLNTGLFAVKDVYQKTGYVPAYLAAPGWSSNLSVHAAMYQNSLKINGHWDAYMFVDLPLVGEDTTNLNFQNIAAYKKTNNFTHENETVFWPMAHGSDGYNYHLSVLAAANFLELLNENDGIPYMTASNTDCTLITRLHLATMHNDAENRVFDDSIINEKLNKHGIASACYVGGRWAIWGCHSADYDTDNADQINVAETNRMMLYYISNDFQHRRTPDVDKPMTANDLKTIIAEEQTRIDALLAIGALTYGEVTLDASAQAKTDIMNGDFAFMFNVTTTPLARSLTAIVNWTDDGFVTYYENMGD